MKTIATEFVLPPKFNGSLLVEYHSNWGDEMDVQGFRVMSVEEWKEYLLLTKDISDFEFYVGTNEWIDYSDQRALLRDMHISILDHNEAKVLSVLFDCAFGEFPSPYRIKEYLSDLAEYNVENEDDE